MKNISRRRFVQTTGTLLAASIAGTAFKNKRSLNLSFSTLGCPDWSFQKIVDFAVQNEYSGLELRGIKRQMDLAQVPEFTGQNLPATMKLMKDNGLQFVDLGSSCNLHIKDVTEREKNIDEAKRFIDLAARMECPFVRVFPNKFLPNEEEKQQTINRMAATFQQLADYANGSAVSVLLETHGDLVHTEDLLSVMQLVDHKHTGLIWDIANMWSITKEPPAEIYPKLKKYIRHTHIKDLKMVDGKENYTLLGQGEVPIFEAINLLKKDRYKGFYSFEWEKLWHPEIAEPEIAIADFAKTFKRNF